VNQVSELIPDQFVLAQNSPNPINPTTTLKYQIPAIGGRKSEVRRVTLKLFDLLGRDVATLVHGEMTPGSYHVTWNGSSLASGVYFYRLQAGGFVQTKKLVLQK
jgi:hypothetical protein